MMNLDLPKLFDLDKMSREPKFKNSFYQQDILSVDQFNRESLSYIFTRAQEMSEMVNKVGACDLLHGYTLACVFYEPSTRTQRFLHRRDGTPRWERNPDHSGYQILFCLQRRKPGGYDDHPGTVLGRDCTAPSRNWLGRKSSQIFPSPDHQRRRRCGGNTRPRLCWTCFTIRKELGSIDGLRIAMVGDLRNGRTVHSLTKLLMSYDVSLRFVSPDTLRLPLNLMNDLIDKGVDVRETDKVEDVIGDVDVLYVTRIQKERFTDLADYEAVKDYFEITPEVMANAKEKMVVMHPLPRVGEIHYKVDKDPRAAYFRQVQNGMFVRMALLAAVLGQA